MRWAGGLFLGVLLAAGVSAQTVRSFGSVVFPGGTRATTPGITRDFGSVVFPGGSPTTPPVRTGPGIPVTPQPVVIRPNPGFAVGNSFNRGNSFNGDNSFRRGGGNPRGNRGNANTVFAYPVFMGGGNYYDSPVPPEAPGVPTSQQPNVTVVMPQQQEARPIVIQMGPDGQYGPMARQNYAAPPLPPEQAEPDAPHYLIAFKDHTIYTSVAYWFDGDTLHYFTKGDTHNQASVALIDRELTERLNRELGIDFKMPPAKK